MTQIKKVYDDRLLNTNKEHKEFLDKLHDEHVNELDQVKSELKKVFDIEQDAQKKYYLQTIEELKHEHEDLLLREKTHQMTQNELGEEYIREKRQYEQQIEFYQNEIQQIKQQYQLELNEQKILFERKSNDYQQLQNDYQEYQLNFNTNSNNVTEVNEQVSYQKKKRENFDFFFDLFI